MLVVAGRPFSADEVIVQNPAPNVHNVLPFKTIRIYRDSSGRTRVDVSVPRDPIAAQFVAIEDPVAGVHLALDTDAKIARRLVDPSLVPWTPREEGVIVFDPKGRNVKTTSESLGRQLLEGLSVEGKRVTSISDPMPGCEENVGVVETWYSVDLRMAVLQKWSNCLGTGTVRLEHIDRTEPDPLLFQVPSGHTTVK
ncbi:MAG: hypothetical protein C5B56_14565 [Proteobacteria bacterium]|nr:MAG: hypothetical protein C5B56_14565 [Pseudomonadota bacterium]